MNVNDADICLKVIYLHKSECSCYFIMQKYSFLIQNTF